MLKITAHIPMVKKAQIDEPNQQGVVNTGNLGDYLVDTVEPQTPQVPDYFEEIPTTNEYLGIPEDTHEAIYTQEEMSNRGDPRDPREAVVDDGIDNAEVISFDYTNRFGAYAGRRTIEPHYTFVPQTTPTKDIPPGTVLVGYDRDVNDIRAFIVGNMHPDGVRYEGINFEPRPEIMIGVR